MRLLQSFMLALLATAAWADTFTGPLSKYYLANLDNNRIYVVQGTSVVESFPMAYSSADGEGVLAVSQTIRTRARYLFGLEAAGEYTLSGIRTGRSYFTPPSDLSVYDGTTDGTYNYYSDHVFDVHGGVFRTDYYWQHPQWLFYPESICGPETSLCYGPSGIAYDPTNDSLWISSKPSSWIWDYSLDGTLLAEFEVAILMPFPVQEGFGYNSALALDPADHTLWMTTGGTNLLRQYSLNGATFGDLLQIGTPSGLPRGFCRYQSGEFQEPAPEPSTLLLLAAAAGIALLVARLRRIA